MKSGLDIDQYLKLGRHHIGGEECEKRAYLH